MDDNPQILVANAFKARAALKDPQYILNVGDNFYWGGIEKTCGEPMNKHLATFLGHLTTCKMVLNFLVSFWQHLGNGPPEVYLLLLHTLLPFGEFSEQLVAIHLVFIHSWSTPRCSPNIYT